MKTTTIILTALGLASCLRPALAQLNIPSDGSDGVFAPTEDTIVDLSQAVTGRWDDNNSANAGKGNYDKDKWAIVFKYSSVNIPGTRSTQLTAKLLRHPRRGGRCASRPCGRARESSLGPIGIPPRTPTRYSQF